MSKRQKYYVVWHGLTPGIYSSWDECLAQVKAFPNAKYKAFVSLQEAEAAYYANYEVKTKYKPVSTVSWQTIIPNGSLAVDAACSGNPYITSWSPPPSGFAMRRFPMLGRDGPQGQRSVGSDVR